MIKAIEILQKPRLQLLQLIDSIDIHLLNEVPAGFNNNIAWNLGHIVAAQQGVCYLRAGLQTHISTEMYELYKPGTKPEKFISQAELDDFRDLFTTTLEQLEQDYQNGIFSNYVPWTTRYGVNINNIDEAISFLPFHDGLHHGYILALRRALFGKQL
ncbi:DinB family protein [Mucilaginibacter sp. UR6-1]|uniref:DinB family protein n=1 Tax=Mucilaginibacter sp. UR6-1 TaxID=1435643 RepID=UPI001E479102|nr:DinB family protein [Mucilaginibacter sp. UR6-1]MCC8410950.1 DinB family protein [Mucilaginibacter sp. UR6-1]